jgi:hypothetical protein
MPFNPEQFSREPTVKTTRELVKNLGSLARDSLIVLGCALGAYISTRKVYEQRQPWDKVADCDVIRPPHLTSERIDSLDRLDRQDLFDLRQLSRPSFGPSELIGQIDDQQHNKDL